MTARHLTSDVTAPPGPDSSLHEAASMTSSSATIPGFLERVQIEKGLIIQGCGWDNPHVVRSKPSLIIDNS